MIFKSKKEPPRIILFHIMRMNDHCLLIPFIWAVSHLQRLVEKPREFDPRGQSDDDPLELFIFDPCKVLTDGVIFILPYYFFAFILRMLSPVSSILCDECTILSSTASATVGSPMASYQLATGSCEDMTIAFLS